MDFKCRAPSFHTLFPELSQTKISESSFQELASLLESVDVGDIIFDDGFAGANNMDASMLSSDSSFPILDDTLFRNPTFIQSLSNPCYRMLSI